MLKGKLQWIKQQNEVKKKKTHMETKMKFSVHK